MVESEAISRSPKIEPRSPLRRARGARMPRDVPAEVSPKPSLVAPPTSPPSRRCVVARRCATAVNADTDQRDQMTAFLVQNNQDLTTVQRAWPARSGLRGAHRPARRSPLILSNG
jgi:hypothetical protein